MNRLPLGKRAQILGLLVEGNSLRATSRLADVSINTVTKLLLDVAAGCTKYQDQTLRNLPCKRLQCDEIWAFVAMKQKTAARKGCTDAGDIWTWTAIDAETKLVPSWLVGGRDSGTAYAFVQDLADRLASRIQLTTDGHKVYLEAVEAAFGADVDYSMLVKLYGTDERPGEARYSPAVCIGTRTVCCSGDPDPRHISTSYVERQNLTMRMSMRRFTRLTNGFSKKVENHVAAVALHFMHYNFARVHKSLRITPAMAAGVSDHVWTLEEIAALAN
jgi:IS1 family transposase